MTDQDRDTTPDQLREKVVDVNVRLDTVETTIRQKALGIEVDVRTRTTRTTTRKRKGTAP
jgi:hypothetical protein